MYVSFFNFFCFSVAYFSIYVSFRAVVSAFWAFLSSRHSSVFLLFLLYSICADKINIHSFIHLWPDRSLIQQARQKRRMQGVYTNGLTRGQHRTGSKSDVYDCFAIIIIIIIIII